jgi:hypothetical protein
MFVGLNQLEEREIENGIENENESVFSQIFSQKNGVMQIEIVAFEAYQSWFLTLKTIEKWMRKK